MLGSGFLNGPGISCQFVGATSRQVFAVWKSSSWIMCVTPPVDSKLLVKVEFSNNGQDFTADGISFTYRSAAVPLEILPSTGPVQGQNRITIVGAHFADAPQFTCKFSDISVPVLSVINSTAAVCGVPSAAQVGCVGFSASNNGVDFSNNLIQFCYIGTCVLLGNCIVLISSCPPVQFLCCCISSSWLDLHFGFSPSYWPSCLTSMFDFTLCQE